MHSPLGAAAPSGVVRIYTVKPLATYNILIKYFAWADQRAKVYFIFHKSSKCAVWKIKYSYANNCYYRCEIPDVAN